MFASSVFINSHPNSVTKSSEFSFDASFSASPSKEYYLKARIGSSSSSLTKGMTFNESNPSSDIWLTDSDSWTKFPKIKTDAAGSWSGALKAKTRDTIILGDNYLVLRIRDVVSSTNSDSTTYPIKVEASGSSSTTETSSQASEASQTAKPTVTIKSFPNQIETGKDFGVSFTFKDVPSTNYYIKGLIGSDSTGKDMNDGLTQSGSGEWLNWNSSWDKFPFMQTNQAGDLEGQINLKSNEIDYEAGYLRIRVRKENANESIDSDLVTLKIIKNTETQSSSATTITQSKQESEDKTSPKPTSKTAESNTTQTKSKTDSKIKETKSNAGTTTKKSVVEKLISEVIPESPPAVLGVSQSAVQENNPLTQSSNTNNNWMLYSFGAVILVVGLANLAKDFSKSATLHKLISRLKMNK